jgi:hypothetical protein
MAEVESQIQTVFSPTTKPSIPAMAQQANMERNVFINSLQNMFLLIGELLSEGKNVEIDLQEFGKFQGMNGQVMYAPFNKLKPTGAQGKQTVKNLMGAQRQGVLPAMDHSFE